MSQRKTVYFTDSVYQIINAAPGESLSSKISGIVTRYGEIISVRPELAITQAEASRLRIEAELKP